MDPALARLRRRTADKVAALAELQVGPVLISALYGLRGEPVTAETAVELHALWSRAIAWASAQQMIATNDAIHGIRGRLELPCGEEQMLTAQEIACATHTSFGTAMIHVGLVERVRDALPLSWEALDRGGLTLAHLKAVEKATHNCTPRVAEAVDRQVIPLAVERGWTPSETGKAARKLVIALDPQGAKERAEAAKDDSDVRLYPDIDGMATVVANGEASLMQSVMAAIDDHAEAMARAGDERTVGIRRVHALHDLVTGNRDATAAGASRRGRGEALLRLDLTTYLGVNDHPGELVGYGPIDADTARRIANDCNLRRLITDPLTGDCIDLGLKAYKPSAPLERIVEAEHPTCTMPGCAKPAYRCEIDHRNERRDGGRTDRCNATSP